MPEPTERRDRLPARRGRGRVRRARCAAPTSSAPTPGCGRCSTPADGRDRRPVPQARRAHQPHRRGHGRRRQAHDVPADGRGRRRRRRRARRPARRRPAAPARSRCSAPPRAPSSPRSRRRPGWSAASAPTPTWSSTTPARSPASPTTSCSRPIADGIPVTLAELVFGVTHEGAADVDDLLDRRTRIGLVPADRARAVPAAERALSIVLDPSPTARPRPRIRGDSTRPMSFPVDAGHRSEADWSARRESGTMTTATGTDTMTTDIADQRQRSSTTSTR